MQKNIRVDTLKNEWVQLARWHVHIHISFVISLTQNQNDFISSIPHHGHVV